MPAEAALSLVRIVSGTRGPTLSPAAVSASVGGPPMKLIPLALVLFALTPAAALAGGTSLVSRDVASGSRRAPHRFDLVGLHWRGSGSVSFRTRSVSGRWSGWRNAAPEDDRPDAGNHELRARGWQLGSP